MPAHPRALRLWSLHSNRLGWGFGLGLGLGTLDLFHDKEVEYARAG